MNNAEKYVYAVYQNQSFSEAAKKLFISQPALSSTVKNHEAQLGYQIFNRSTSPITLTREGSLYIEYLEERIYLEKQLTDRLQQLNHNYEKKISIGGSKSAAFNIIPKLCSEFNRQFPDVSLKIDAGESGPVSDLFDKLNRGVLDFIISTNVNPGEYNTLLLKKEKYMIVVHKNYPGIDKLKKYSLTFDELLSGEYPPKKEITDWSLFENVKLFRPGSNTKTWKTFSKFYKITADEPCRVINHRRLDMQYSLMKEGMGAILMPRSSILAKGDDSENLYYFDVRLPDNLREIVLVYREDSLHSQCVRDFLELAKEMYPQE